MNWLDDDDDDDGGDDDDGDDDDDDDDDDGDGDGDHEDATGVLSKQMLAPNKHVVASWNCACRGILRTGVVLVLMCLCSIAICRRPPSCRHQRNKRH